ncbi:MAG: IscS subfamily cysteine desulfurase [Chitinophagales bacterium]|nr:IscS subfamily cysteine desulfurase [Chitinophagales bacterium]MDW8427795.1 IscS subfamily cysteine desulfurase [Chitinophagales bacterium]
MNLPIYLDNSATTPVDPRVLDAMLPYFKEKFGNAASRSHPFGWIAEEAVDYAREQVARLINADAKEIIFTSGATESNNLALKGVFEMYRSKGNHIITVVTEHKCVLEAARHLERLGAEVSYLPVNHLGEIDLDQLEDAIKPTTILISVMYANNEIGVIHPIAEIGALAERHGVLLHTDATQAAGKVPIDVKKEHIHLLSMSAHKMYGPKGIGCLYVRRRGPRVKVTAQMDGGGHERGMRSGTLNVPGIVGFGKACELCQQEMPHESERLRRLRNKLESALLQIEEVTVNGSTENRLPHITNLSFKWVEGEGLMMAFNKDIAVSSGSACTSASLEPSYVLKSLGLGDELAHSSIRFSLGRFNTEEEIDYTIERVTDAVHRLREMSPLWEMYKEGIDLKTVEFRPH